MPMASGLELTLRSQLLDIGWDGEGDVGYNGSVVNSSVGYNGSRQSLTLYNNSGSPITLNNIHMVTQAGNGVCRLYDITITTTTQSATELTLSSVPEGPNGFYLDFSDNSATYKLGKDASSTGTTLPCVDFDGNDHLQIAYHSDFDLGNGNFTIECYAKTTDATTNYPSIVGRWQQNGAAHWDFRPASDDASHNFFFIYHTGSANITVNSGTSITDGQWHHLAVARDGTNLRMFVDGALVHTHNIGTTTISNSTSVPLYLGYDPYGNSYYKGQTSNLRIVKGTALYTAAFTKPTTPLTNVSNTKLLCFQSDTSVTAAAVTPNSLTVSSGDPEARSVSDSDWNVNNLSVSNLISAGNAYNGSLNGYMPAGVAQATDPSQLASTSNRTHFFLVNQDNSINITVVATSTTMAVASSVYDGWGSNNPTTTLNNGTVTPSSSGSDTSVSGKTLAVNYFQNLTIGNTYTISTKNGGAGNPHRVHYVTGATVQNQPVLDTDSVFDSPTNYDDGTNVGGNYATWNVLTKKGSVTTSNGNLEANAANSGTGYVLSTIPLSSGKFYCEILFEGTMAQTTNYSYIGIVPTDNALSHSGNDIFRAKGALSIDGTSTTIRGTRGVGGSGGDVNITYQSSYGFDENDIIGIAIDCDTPQVTFYKNGVSIGTFPHAMEAGKSWVVFVNDWANASDTEKYIFNAGQRPFAHTPPTGFKSICTQNLDDPLIADGSDYFDTLLWTGDGASSTRTITGLSMENAPDWIWAKERNGGSSHALFDAVRGFGTNNVLKTNSTDAEGVSNGGYINSTTKSSITWAQGTSAAEFYDANNKTYVAWCWDAGDLVTNSAYNQDRIWSDGVTFSGSIIAPATNAFDGNSATSASPYDGANGGGTPQWVQVTFSPGIPYTSSVKVERQNGNPSNVTVAMNGGTPINSTFQAYTTVATGSGTLTSIKVQNNGSSNTAGISRIEVDGKVLVDKGVIPVGSLNSSAYNSGEVWSTTGTLSVDLNGSTVSNMTGPLTKAFEGSLASSSMVYEGSAYTNGTKTYTYTFGTAQTNITSARVYLYQGNSAEGGAAGVGNGTVNKTQDGTYGWLDVTSTIPANGTVTAMTVTTTATSGVNSSRNGFHAIELNGKMLLDNNVTPVDNFPSIASTVRSNQTAGFSIIGFTAPSSATSSYNVGHALNATPTFWIWKSRSAAGGWQVYSTALGATNNRLALNSTDSAYSAYPGSATSSIINLSDGPTAAWGGTNIIYAFTPVKNYSAMGTYIGGGSAYPYVNLGFKPAFVMIKNTSTGATHYDWQINDSARNPFNRGADNVDSKNTLFANLSDQEDKQNTDWQQIDFLANGFRVNDTSVSVNASGSTHLYFAFAENPFKIARAG